jgi:hypothetical protein
MRPKGVHTTIKECRNGAGIEKAEITKQKKGEER